MDATITKSATDGTATRTMSTVVNVAPPVAERLLKAAALNEPFGVVAFGPLAMYRLRVRSLDLRGGNTLRVIAETEIVGDLVAWEKEHTHAAWRLVLNAQGGS